MALMREVWNGTLYKLLRRTINNGTIVLLFLKVEMKNIEPLLYLEERQCYGIKEYDIFKRKAFENYIVKVCLEVFFIAH
jgi:hypothetical protein